MRYKVFCGCFEARNWFKKNLFWTKYSNVYYLHLLPTKFYLIFNVWALKWVSRTQIFGSATSCGWIRTWEGPIWQVIASPQSEHHFVTASLKPQLDCTISYLDLSHPPVQSSIKVFYRVIFHLIDTSREHFLNNKISLNHCESVRASPEKEEEKPWYTGQDIYIKLSSE
jgi:hypothetical protein